MSEYVGTPDIKVILRKKSFQFVVPGDLDLSVAEFYTQNADPNLNSENIYFMQEIGIAMVRPLLINRANYVDSAVSPVRSFVETLPVVESIVPEGGGPIDQESDGVWKYLVEVPIGAEPETEDEVMRRVFYPYPTLVQTLGREDNGNRWDNAHYLPLEETWKEGETDWYHNDADGKYLGPEWETWTQDPPPGAKRHVTWIHQSSSADNVEWMLLQAGYNFTNQPFWINIDKQAIVKMDAIDKKGKSRYHRYGGREVGAFFAIRLGWNDPIGGKYEDGVRVVNKDGYGPYDLVFPIEGTPFIWDHAGKKPIEEDDTPSGESILPDSPGIRDALGGGSVAQDGDEEGDEEAADEGKRSDLEYYGFMADERTEESWRFPKEEGSYSIFVFNIRGKMLIKTNWAEGVWEFPQNFDKVSEYTKNKYENFYISAGKIALMGRGFSFRMSYNPMEFDIYKDGEKRSPSARMVSQPIQERTDYQGKKGGILDCWNYDKGATALSDFQNLLVIPNAQTDDDTNGNRVSASYGCDVVSTPYEGNGFCCRPQSSFTSMMIPIDGIDPHSESFNPESDTSVIYTLIKSPGDFDKPSSATKYRTQCGFREATTLNFSNKLIEVGINCRKPTIGKFIGNTSDRFASPVVWRLKGKHYSPLPDKGSDIDITSLVENISYDCTSPDFFTVRQNYKIKFLIPKQGILETDYKDLIPDEYLDRKELIKLLTGGLREVQVSLGWKNTQKEDPAGSSRRVVFTGISNSIPTTNRYAIDKITLNCNDRMQILEDWPILNSPWYDGMNLSDAFMHLATISGLPKGMFKVNSKRAYTEILDVGYNLKEPTLKFDNGTSLFDALKVLSKRFWHVIKSSRFGIIELTDLNQGNRRQVTEAQNAVIDELELTEPSYVFYMDGADSNIDSPFQRVYNSVTINKTMNERLTSVEILSMDRDGNKFVLDNRSVDVDGIENPDSPDFLGYKKPFRQMNPAFGSVEKVKYYRELLEKHMFQTPLKVSFTTYGRPTLRPFDIIALQMPKDGHDSYFGVYNPAGGASDDLTEYIKLRVKSISGEINLKSDMKYSMTITAEHK